MKWLKHLAEFLNAHGIRKKAIEFCDNSELGYSIFVGCSKDGFSFSFEFYDDTCEGDEMIANIMHDEKQVGYAGTAEYCFEKINQFIKEKQILI